MQLDWLNSTLSPVIYGDIELSIKKNTKIHKKYIVTELLPYIFLCIERPTHCC